jgi:CubicO group peptidase (beta-lactamase class C family)
MRKYFIALVLSGLLSWPAIAQEKPKDSDSPKPSPPKLAIADLLKTVQEAYSRSSSQALHALTTAEFQKTMTAKTLGAVLGAWKTRYGKWDQAPEQVRQVGSVHVYKVKAERGVLHLRLIVDESMHVQGIGLAPAFLDDLPARVDLPEVERRLASAVEQTLANYKVPSVSLALVKGDRIVWNKAFGYQNLGHHIPADTDTAYITGSILKVVVATALMQQVDAGKLKLDEPVNGYLNGLHIPNPFEKERELTARHLLSHHGGVPNGAQMVKLWRRELPLSLGDVVRKRVRVTRKPGEAFQYSNYGYALNGYLLAQLDNTSFERALSQDMLIPLEMRNTTFEPTPTMTENMAIPYENSSLGIGLAPTALMRLDVYPAGDVFSTPTDMAKFLIPHMNEGKYHGKQILSANSVKEMATLQFSGKDAKSGVGLGWMISNARGRKLLWHNGAVPGFFTYLAINPDKKSGVVLFCNKYNPLEGGLGLLADPLVDLRELAIELLDRLPLPTQTLSRVE